MMQDTSATLLGRLRIAGETGDADAWSDFAAIYSPLIHKYCCWAGLQEADAADVTQEVLLKVMKSIANFMPDREQGRFRGWLGTVIRGRLAEFFRERKRNLANGQSPELALERVQGELGSSSWDASFNDHLIRVALANIRGEFAENSWLAFEITWKDSLSATEAATRTGLSVGAVYVHKSRILARLEKEISALAEDVPHLAGLDHTH